MKNKLLETALIELRDSLYPSFKEFNDDFEPVFQAFMNDSQEQVFQAGNLLAVIFNTMVSKEFIVVQSTGNHENFFNSLVEYFKNKGAAVDFCTSRKRNFLEWEDYSLAEKVSQKYESLSVVLFAYILKTMKDSGKSQEDVKAGGVKFFYDNFPSVLTFFLELGVFLDKNRCEICGETPQIEINGINLSIEYEKECN